jgi:16S rRNA (guanine966-N2)-methyltransferase
LRPTPDRVRETLFNWLGQTLDSKRCLDLFAGSGALGFEAASRGAAEVVMVEQDRVACHALQENCKKLGYGQVTTRCEDALDYLRRQRARFDVIFLDPPFQSDYLHRALPLLADKLSHGGHVYVESAAEFKPDAMWQVSKHARAGSVYYQLLQTAELAPENA